MIQVRDDAGSSGGSEKWSDLGYILEGESTRLLRDMKERKRDVKGNSKVWDLNNWVNGGTLYRHGKSCNRMVVPGQGGAGPQ